MGCAAQFCPPVPTPPDEADALLRASIILEEALETVNALGVTVSYIPGMGDSKVDLKKNLSLRFTHEPDLVAIADGCADIFVVTTGTLIACGIADQELLELVDQNNMDKFKPGYSISPAGKLIKPPGHKPPDIGALLARQLPLERLNANQL